MHSLMKRSSSAGCVALLAGLLVAQSASAGDLAAPGEPPADPGTSSGPAVSEDTPAARVRAEPSATRSRPNGAAGWTLVGASGALAVGAGIFGVMALQAQSDFQHTSLERTASDASDRYTRDTAALAVSATAAVVAALIGTYLLLQSGGGSGAPAAQTGLGRTGFAVLF